MPVTLRAAMNCGRASRRTLRTVWCTGRPTRYGARRAVLLAFAWLLRGTTLRTPRAEQPFGTALSLTRPGDGTDSAGASATP